MWYEQARESKTVEEYDVIIKRKFAENQWTDFIPRGRNNTEKWKIFCYKHPSKM
jgi:hypothetical protein